MHRRAADPIAAGHLGDLGAVVEDFQDGLIALLHQPHLHEHDRPPSHLRARRPTAKKEAPTSRWTLEGVAQVPEPLSPRYRSRVSEVSPGYRSHGVQHEPEPHTSGATRRH
jgi:hypothetical protein